MPSATDQAKAWRRPNGQRRQQMVRRCIGMIDAEQLRKGAPVESKDVAARQDAQVAALELAISGDR